MAAVVGSPALSAALASNADLQQLLCFNPDFAAALAGNRNLAFVVAANKGLPAALVSNAELTEVGGGWGGGGVESWHNGSGLSSVVVARVEVGIEALHCGDTNSLEALALASLSRSCDPAAYCCLLLLPTAVHCCLPLLPAAAACRCCVPLLDGCPTLHRDASPCAVPHCRCRCHCHAGHRQEGRLLAGGGRAGQGRGWGGLEGRGWEGVWRQRVAAVEGRGPLRAVGRLKPQRGKYGATPSLADDLAPWPPGPLAPWPPGPLAPWAPGPLAPWAPPRPIAVSGRHGRGEGGGGGAPRARSHALAGRLHVCPSRALACPRPSIVCHPRCCSAAPPSPPAPKALASNPDLADVVTTNSAVAGVIAGNPDLANVFASGLLLFTAASR